MWREEVSTAASDTILSSQRTRDHDVASSHPCVKEGVKAVMMVQKIISKRSKSCYGGTKKRGRGSPKAAPIGVVPSSERRDVNLQLLLQRVLFHED